MGIKTDFKKTEIDGLFQLLLERVDTSVLSILQRVGEEVVTYAKMIPPDVGFTDRTGNLRSSIGYVVAKDGEVLNVAFEAVRGGHDGVSTGQRLALDVAKQQGQGYSLIVVAGMNYAIYVESKGRDVLTSSETKAGKLLEQYMKSLIVDISKEFQ